MTAVSEPTPVPQPVPQSQLLQHRIDGKREAAVLHERSVRPCVGLPEEDELCVSNQLQSFRERVQEHVSDHGVEGIGACTVFANYVLKSQKQRPKMTVICIVFLMVEVLNSLLTCRGTIWKNSSKTKFLT